MVRDVPDYKPFLLREPFLAILFLFVCSLTATLEYLLRTLPQGHDRNGIPRDSPYLPVQKRWATAQQAHAIGPRRKLIPPSDHDARTGPITTYATQQAHTIGPRGKLIPIPPSDHYANTDLITTYLTTANKWYGNPVNPYLRTPLFPGDDATGKCVYDYVGIVVTSNSSGCLAILGMDPSFVDSWKRKGLTYGIFARSQQTFAFPVDAETGKSCGTDPSRWIPPVDKAKPIRPQDDLISLFSINSCTYEGGHIQTTVPPLDPSYTKPTAKTTSSPESDFIRVLSVYQAVFVKEDAQSPSPYYGSWRCPAPPDSDAPRDPQGGVQQYLQVHYIFSWPGRSEMVESITWLCEKDLSRLAEEHATTTPPMAHPNTKTDSLAAPSNPPASASPSSAATATEVVATTNVEQYWLPQTYRFETPTRVTISGTLVSTSMVTSTIQSSILVGVPAVMATPSLRTLTNPDGSPTATVTKFPHGSPILKPGFATLTGPGGSPTATVPTSVFATSVVGTLTGPDGVPTATRTMFPVIPEIPGARPADDIVLVASFSYNIYAIVYFAPVLLTALLLIPVQALDSEIKLLMPYRLLTGHEGGVDAAEALCLPTHGVSGRLAGWRLLVRHRDALSVVGDAMVLCAAGLVALSGEAVGMKLRGACVTVNVSSCLITVATFAGPARAAQALLGLMMALVVILWWVLARWRTGVAAHPASIVSVCALLQVSGTAEVMARTKGPLGHSQLNETKIRLGWTERDDGPPAENYGLIIVSAGRGLTRRRRVGGGEGEGQTPSATHLRGAPKLHVPVGKRVTQACFLFFLCGLLAVILYYENTVFEDPSQSPFEAFMDSQSFGVTMLFTVLGEFVTFTWDHLHGFAETATYLAMARRPQPASLSVLCSRPTNAFTGFWRAVRRGDILTGSLAFAGILSKFLPALLASIPFASAQTWRTHEICTWTTVGVLALMIIILLGYIRFARWPEMPDGVVAGSLAGTVYFVCDSYMLRDFARLSMLGTRERDRRVERMARRYRFGWTMGVSGERRIGCDFAEGSQGFKMRSLAPLGFGIGGRMKPR